MGGSSGFETRPGRAGAAGAVRSRLLVAGFGHRGPRTDWPSLPHRLYQREHFRGEGCDLRRAWRWFFGRKPPGKLQAYPEKKGTVSPPATVSADSEAAG